MEESGKRRLAAAGVVTLGLAYFLVCARPLPKELVLVPVWARPLAALQRQTPQAAQDGGRLRPFKFGGKFGYFAANGSIPLVSPIPYGVALSDTAFATYDRLSEGFSIKAPSGAELAKCAIPGYPFFSAGRRFVVAPGQSAVSELSADGNPLWTHEFPAVVTAFGSSPGIAAFGLLDGRIVGIDPNGATILDFEPGGSRIPCVYGVAVSPDGALVAAICGIDRQRLVVMEKGATAYRVAWHRWLDTDFRRPVAIAFTADGKRLVHEDRGGIGVWDRATRGDHLIKVASAAASLGLALGDRGLLVLVTGAGLERRLLIADTPDRRIVDTALGIGDTFLDADGDSIFIGAGDTLARMDLREE